MWLLAAGGLVAGLLSWQVSGLPVLVLLGPLAAVGLPWLLSDPAPVRQIARLEALEEWTRSLSGMLGSGQAVARSQTSGAVRGTSPAA